MAFTDQFGNPKGFVGRMMLWGMNMGHSPMAKWGLKQFDIPSKGCIVDIGCGGGYNIRRLLEKSLNSRIFGVDISDVSVSKSKTINKKHLGTRCEIYQASADNLPFEDCTIDLATAFETVFFWPDLNKCFAEVYRILKAGGSFAVINDPGDPNKHWDKMIPGMTSWKAEEIEDFMRSVGFAEIKISKEKNMFCVVGLKK